MHILSLFCVITLPFIIHRQTREADYGAILRQHAPFDDLQNKYYHGAYYFNIVREQGCFGGLLHTRGTDVIAMLRDHDPCVDRRLVVSDD